MKASRIKWTLTLSALLLFVVTVALGVRMQVEQVGARVAAGDRLDEVRVATGEVLTTLLGDAADELRRTNAEDPAPERFESVRTLSGEELPPSFLATEAGDAALVFDPLPGESPEGGRLVVAARLDEGWRVGTLSLGALREALVADPRIGPVPVADADDDEARRYTRIQLVDESGDVRWRVPLVEEERGETDPDARPRTSRATSPRQAIGRGEACEFVPGQDKLPPSFEGGTTKSRQLGVWGPIDGVPGLHALVSISDGHALGAAAGRRIVLPNFGIDALTIEDLPRWHLWHLTLGAAVLLLVASSFFWLQRRDVQPGVLLRTFKFALPYKGKIVTVILVGILFSSTKLVEIYLGKQLFDEVLIDREADAEAKLWRIGFQIVGLAIAAGTLNYLRVYLLSWVATAMIADVRLAIGRKIAHLSMSFFHRMRAGDLVARIERDVASMRKVLAQVFEKVFVQPFLLVGCVLLAFILNFKLALVLLGMPLIVLPLFRIAKKIKSRAEKRQDLMADISHVIFQILTGIKVVKAFRGEEREAERLRVTIRRFVHQARRIHRLAALSDGIMDLLQMFGAAIVMVGGGYLVLGGQVLIGDLVAFTVIVAQVYKAAKQITSVLNKFIDSLPGTARVFEVLDEESEIQDGPRTLRPGPLDDGIRLEGVRFGYNDREVLRGVDLHIPAGQVCALVGPTGAGKTTLCDVVARFYDPTEGRVTYDGIDSREFTLDSLLGSVAIVTQDAFLFNAPIEENIRYGKPGASMEEVVTAARASFVHDEIERMEGGYDKIAGERGTALSGGQRQRVTIARAILKDAPVLILDEATSALDSAAEQQVQSALDELMRGRTTIVVAHRLSTIRNADKIVVLDAGVVVEEGPPDALLADPDSRFRKMYEIQFGPVDPDELA